MTKIQKETRVRITDRVLTNGTSLVVAALLILIGYPVTAMAQQASGDRDHGEGSRTATFKGEKHYPKSTPRVPPAQAVVKPHRPGMDAGTYAALKAQAAATLSSPSPFRSSRSGGLGAQPLGLFLSFAGSDRFGSGDSGFIFTPPDVNSAVGIGQIVEVTNNAYACYNTAGTLLQSTPMSTFFGYSTKLLTDPRVVFDSIWNRWIVVEVAHDPENPSTHFFFLAASVSSDCTGGYFVYQINMVLVPGDFYDYPQVGYDQDAILTTFNVFNPPNALSPKYAEVDMWAKARIYNGLGISAPFINGFGATLTPNVERDQNGTTVLLRNVPNTNQVQLIKLVNTSKNNPSSSTVNVTTGSVCNVPASASQPGTGATLDTLDTRFQAPGTQNGNFLWNVQTCGPGLPTPRLLQIDINANTVTQTDFVFANGCCSFDFNPSLATNDFGDVLVNWSSTDPPSGLNAGEIFASRPAGGLFSAPSTCFRSGVSYPDFRWGDTSGTSVDYSDPTQQTWWTSNETIQVGVNNWGTQICGITRP